MRVLIVLSHPNSGSFSHAVAEAFAAGATEAGHDVEVADLSAEGFDPRWSEADVAMDQGGPVPADVLAEQARLERADALCLVFPLYWYGMPALLKGWIDRVFTYGWAYDQVGDPSKSLLPARPCVLLVPAGANPEAWEAEGTRVAMERIWIDGTLRYFGFPTPKLHFLGGADGSPARREAHLRFAFQAGRDLRPLGLPLGLDDSGSGG